MANPVLTKNDYPNLKKLTKSLMITQRNKDVFKYAFYDVEKNVDYSQEDNRKKLKTHPIMFVHLLRTLTMGWRFMNDVTVVCYAILTFLVAHKLSENNEELKEKLNNISSGNVALILSALISGDGEKLTKLLGGTNALKIVFVTLLSNNYSESHGIKLGKDGKYDTFDKSKAETVWAKFKKRLEGVKEWKLDREWLEVIKEVFDSAVYNKVKDELVEVKKDRKGHEKPGIYKLKENFDAEAAKGENKQDEKPEESVAEQEPKEKGADETGDSTGGKGTFVAPTGQLTDEPMSFGKSGTDGKEIDEEAQKTTEIKKTASEQPKEESESEPEPEPEEEEVVVEKSESESETEEETEEETASETEPETEPESESKSEEEHDPNNKKPGSTGGDEEEEKRDFDIQGELLTISGDSGMIRTAGWREKEDTIKSIILVEDKISRIMPNAFENMSSLETVSGINVTEIGEGAFKGCAKLKEVTFTEKLKTIEDEAFAGCKSLTKDNIADETLSDEMKKTIYYQAHPEEAKAEPEPEPESVSEKSKVFEFIPTDDRRQVVAPGTLITQFNDGNFTEATIDADCAAIDRILKQATKLEFVTLIGNFTTIPTTYFTGQSKFKKIELPSTVKTISDEAFRECTNITDFTVPEKVKVVPKKCFNGCIRLKSITLPDGLEQIAENAFYGCTDLSSIEIPKNVTVIGKQAFQKCSNLATITVKCTGDLSISKNAFKGLPGSVTIKGPAGCQKAKEALEQSIYSSNKSSNLQTTDKENSTVNVTIEDT